MLFGAGAMIAVAMEMLRVPALVFALGMYLPLELNTPALVGGVLSYAVNARSERPESLAARCATRVIVASGFMAGGGLEASSARACGSSAGIART